MNKNDNNISDFFNEFSDIYDVKAFNESIGLKFLSSIETDFLKKNLNPKKTI